MGSPNGYAEGWPEYAPAWRPYSLGHSSGFLLLHGTRGDSKLCLAEDLLLSGIQVHWFRGVSQAIGG